MSGEAQHWRSREELEGEVARLRAENAELRRQVAEVPALLRELDGLRRRVEELTKQLEEANRAGKRQAGPFRRKKRKKDPKRPGQKPGHPGAHRAAPDEFDQEKTAPASCTETRPSPPAASQAGPGTIFGRDPGLEGRGAWPRDDLWTAQRNGLAALRARLRPRCQGS